MSNFYSKGPWKAETLNKTKGLGVQIKSSDGEHICSVNSGIWQNNEGNAKLIQKAPTLLARYNELITGIKLFKESIASISATDFDQRSLLILNSFDLWADNIENKLDLTETKI